MKPPNDNSPATTCMDRIVLRSALVLLVLGAVAGGCKKEQPSSSNLHPSNSDPAATQKAATIAYLYVLQNGISQLDAEIEEKQIPIPEQYSRWTKLFSARDTRNVDPKIVEASVRVASAYMMASVLINRLESGDIRVAEDVKKVEDEIASARIDWFAAFQLMLNKYGSD